MTTVSPDTGEPIALFNPRVHSWDKHFAMVGPEVVGLTETGRATIQLLGINDGERVATRSELQVEGLL